VFSVVAGWRAKENFLRPHHNWLKEMIGLCHKQQIVLYKQFGIIWLWQQKFYRLIQSFFDRRDGKQFELVTPLLRENWTKGIKDRVKRGKKEASAEQKRKRRQIRKTKICLTYYDYPPTPRWCTTPRWRHTRHCQLGKHFLGRGPAPEEETQEIKALWRLPFVRVRPQQEKLPGGWVLLIVNNRCSL
jgi:hypothetical protein